jgi:hypothetical protein
MADVSPGLDLSIRNLLEERSLKKAGELYCESEASA